MNRLERPAPNRQVRRRYRWPKRLRGRRGSSFPTRPRPVRLPCPHGLHQTWARSAVRVVARLPTPASRRDQRRPNRQRQRGGHGNTRPMPVAVLQRLLARVRDRDESLGILIGVFAINPVLRRSCRGRRPLSHEPTRVCRHAATWRAPRSGSSLPDDAVAVMRRESKTARNWSVHDCDGTTDGGVPYRP